MRVPSAQAAPRSSARRGSLSRHLRQAESDARLVVHLSPSTRVSSRRGARVGLRLWAGLHNVQPRKAGTSATSFGLGLVETPVDDRSLWRRRTLRESTCEEV